MELPEYYAAGDVLVLPFRDDPRAMVGERSDRIQPAGDRDRPLRLAIGDHTFIEKGSEIDVMESITMSRTP